MANYEQTQKKIKLELIRTILKKVFDKTSEIELSVLLEEFFVKHNIPPEAMIRYLKQISLIMPLEIDIKQNKLRRK